MPRLRRWRRGTTQSAERDGPFGQTQGEPFGRAQGKRARLLRKEWWPASDDWPLASEVNPVGEDEGQGGAADDGPEDHALQKGADAHLGEGLFAEAGADQEEG